MARQGRGAGACKGGAEIRGSVVVYAVPVREVGGQEVGGRECLEVVAWQGRGVKAVTRQGCWAEARAWQCQWCQW